MDTLAYSVALAQEIAQRIKQSGKTKQQIAQISGIPWTTFCRRLEHSEKSYLTIPEAISICDALGLNFIQMLTDVEISVTALAKGV